MFRFFGVFVGVVALLATTLVSVLSPSPVQAAPRLTDGPRSIAAAEVPDGPAVIAHRGASAYTPENTMAAFERAREMDADVVETDVQRSKDGVLVLLHDTTLDRTTDVERRYPDRAPWNVRDFTYAEIRKLDAGSWRGERFEDERIPTLNRLLAELTGSGMGLRLEVKSPELYPGIGEDVRDAFQARPYWLVPGRLVVQSFDWEFMRDFTRLLPSVPAGLLGTPDSDELADLAEYADEVNPKHTTVDGDYVDRVHKLGMDCHLWTVDEEEDIERALDLGTDGIISNRPDVAREVLDEHRAEERPAAA
ncbi:MAG: glycerophosphodiester phosphodiesterase [Streptosporangiales bacterium]|nr:glycerophosphodiester phosphodiesterase [Streptosporangiales bacterium]